MGVVVELEGLKDLLTKYLMLCSTPAPCQDSSLNFTERGLLPLEQLNLTGQP
jgi:hypothetical protein